MPKTLAVLNIEDSESDSDLIARVLKKAGFKITFKRVETAAQMRAALRKRAWDIIIADYSLPQFDGYAALAFLQKTGLDIPFIAVSGTIGEETAVAMMKAGAHDYLMKDNLTRLVPAVVRELEQAEVRRERKQAEEALLASENRFRVIFEHANDAMHIENANDEILAVNSRMCELMGYSREELLKMRVADLQAPEKRKPGKVIKNELARHGGAIFEGLNLHRDGRYIPVEISISRIEQPAGDLYVSVVRDITGRKHAEEALHASEKRFRVLIEHSLDSISLLSPDGALLWESPSTIRTLGYAQDQFIGLKMFDLVHPDDLESVLTQFAEIVQKPRSSEHGLFRLKHSSGSWRWMELIATNLIDEPSVNAIVVNYRDVTERKLAEQALQHAKDFAENVVQTANVIFIQLDNTGKIQKFNSTAEEITGYTEDEVIGRNWDETLVPRERFPDVWKEFDRLASMGETTSSFENPILTKQGEEKQIVWKNSVLHQENKVVGIISFGIDITERKQMQAALLQSEQAYRTLFENVPVGLYRTSADGYWLDANPALIRMFGYHDRESFLDVKVENLYVDPAANEKFYAEMVKSDIVTSIESEFRKKDGTIFWAEDNIRIIRNENGEPLFYEGSLIDITERKQSEGLARESEARYRGLFEDSPVSLLEEDFSAVKLRLDALRNEGIKDFRTYFASHPQMVLEYISLVKIVDVNKTALKLFGAKVKADVLQDLNRFVVNDSTELFQNELVSIAQGKSHFDWEGVNQTLDGRQIIIRLSLKVVTGYEDTLSKVIISIVDITAQMHAEKTIRESEKSLREAQMIAGLGSYTLDIPSEKWASSDILNQIFGIEESYSRSTENWIALVHPDWRQEMSDYFANEVVGKHNRFNKEYKIVRMNDGAERWVHGLGKLEFNAQNQPVKMRGTIQDITERIQAEDLLRKSEKRYHDLFEDSPIALRDEDFSAVKQWLDALRQEGVTDFHTYLALYPEAVVECAKMVKIKDVNKAALKMYRADSKDNMPKNLAEILSSKNLEHFKDQLAGIAQGQVEFSWEGIDQTIDGGQVYVEANWSVASGYENDLSKVIVSLQDITERKQTEAEIKYQLSELEVLYENGLVISSLLEPKQIAQRMVEIIEKKLDWHHAAIRLYDTYTDSLELLALNSPEIDQTQIAEQIKRINQTINTPDKGLSGWVIRHGEAVRIGKLKDDPRYIETYAGINSGLYVPIKSGDRVIGAISIESEKENAFTERDANTLTTLANQAAIAFVNARLYLWLQKELNERYEAEEEVRKLNIELEQRVLDRTAQIEAAKHRLELATQAGQIGVWEFNPRENKVIWDERMHTIHHIPVGEFDGTSQTWAQLIHPDDIEQSQLNQQLAVTKNLLMNKEHRIILADGSVRHVMTSAVTANTPEGIPDRIIGINMDITERKQIEQSLRESETYARLLFDAVTDPVSVTEHDGSIVDVNREFEKQFGIVRDEAHGRHMSELHIYPETELDKREKYMTEILQGQPAKPVELDYYVPGDRTHTLELHSYLINVSGRQLILNSAHDITAHKKAEEVQRLAKSEMERALRTKNEFLANMSHELRTPLTGILGLSEALQLKTYGELTEKQYKTINTIEESGRHLLTLINDILDLSKIEAGKLELQILPCSISDVCQASLKLVKGMAHQKRQKVHYSPTAEPIMVHADARRLKQILVNLLSNAVKFTAEGGELGLEVQADESESKVKLTVWDKGIGIKAEDLRTLFNPFTQIDSSLAREYSGTGLGLYLVQRLTELHNGGIEVDSVFGEGSRFTIILPLSDQISNSLLYTQGPVTKRLSSSATWHDPSKLPLILLADDNEVVLQMIADFLETKQFRVIKTRNGVELLEQALKFHPDIVLVDIQMPVMDGLETIRRIRANEDPSVANVPVIAVTALAMPGDREFCLRAGANIYMSKPVGLKELFAVLQKQIGNEQ